MISSELESRLRNQISELASFQKKAIFDRSDLGEFNFNPVRAEFDALISVVGLLSERDLSTLFTRQAEQIVLRSKNIAESCAAMVNFRLAHHANPLQEREAIQNRFREEFYEFVQIATPYIAFLDYVNRGRNISFEQIEQDKAIILAKKAEIEKDLEHAKSDIEKVKDLIGVISSASGALPFAIRFKNEADEMAKNSKKWLKATAICAIVSISIPVVFIVISFTIKDLTQYVYLSLLTSKAALMITSIGATAWCGRN